MKKKILFVIPSLEAGGGEKSLVTLLNTIDRQRYDIDLLLLKNAGIFLKLVPEGVNIISLDGDYTTFTQPLLSSVLNFLKKGKLQLAMERLFFTLKIKSIANKGIAEQKSWQNLRSSIPGISKEYDAAIGFLEKSSIYFVVDCVKAKTKIGFIHNDYNQLRLDAAFDLPYFEKLAAIATVSEQCKTVLQEVFPMQKNKIKIVRNIVSPIMIRQMADEKIDLEPQSPMLLSIGRLHPQKGFDIAIEAAKILGDKNIGFTWYVIGEGAERTALEKKIIYNGVQESFVLLGLKENPYPYMKMADLIVQPSRYEGKSIAIDEAKILQKPVIVTNFTTAKDQIEHLKNGIICEINPLDLATAIENLLQNKALQAELSLHLSQEEPALGTENEIGAFYQLLNDGT